MDKPSSVVLFAPYYTNNIDAASQKTDQLLDYLLQCGYKVILYRQHQAVNCAKSSVECIDLPVRFNPGFVWRLYILLILVRITLTNSLIITDFNPTLPFGNSNVLHIVHHLDDFPSALPSRLVTSDAVIAILFKALWKLYLRLSPRQVIVPSETIANEVMLVNPRKIVYPIYNRIRIRAFPVNDANTRFYDIIMVGHNVHRKNYSRAFSIIALFASFLPSARVAIVGNGVSSLRDLYSHYSIPANTISYYSNISDTLLSDLYLRSRIFFSTSRQEGFCIPFLEAQLHGCLTITPNLPIFQEFSFSRNWFYASQDSSQMIVETILNLLATENRYPFPDLPSRLSEKEILSSFKSIPLIGC